MIYSVIIPCYNSGKTIERAIESVLDDISEDYIIELIIVDDCSKDDTISIIKDYAKSSVNHDNFRVVLSRNEMNKGASASRNVGIELSKGDYLLFLDSDDFFVGNKIRRVHHLIKNNPISFLFHDWIVLENCERDYSFYEFPEGELKKVSRYFSYVNLIKNHICTPCAVVSREAIEKFNLSLTHMEDLELWSRIMLNQGEAYYLNESLTCLGHELNQGEGLSSNHQKMRECELKMYRILRSEFKTVALLYPFYLAIHNLKKVRDLVRRTMC